MSDGPAEREEPSAERREKDTAEERWADVARLAGALAAMAVRVADVLRIRSRR